MIKTHISLEREDVAMLKLANQKFGCGDKVSSSELVSWAVQMVISAYEHEAQ
jgi:hypothetical protein